MRRAEAARRERREAEEATLERARLLCHVCSAEEELKARAPVKLNHGKVMERGASGFTGWTKGLRRTDDRAALKRMYSAKRPAEVRRSRRDGV